VHVATAGAAAPAHAGTQVESQAEARVGGWSA